MLPIQQVMRVRIDPSLDGALPMQIKFFPLLDNSQMKESKEEGQSLFDLNQLGWKLEGFSVVRDAREIEMQVGIFSYSENPLIQKSRMDE